MTHAVNISDLGHFHLENEEVATQRLMTAAALSPSVRKQISADAAALARQARQASASAVMDSLMAEYELSSKEGIALMCLAEAMLRVPDAATVSELIADKIAPPNWSMHRGHSDSAFVNAATWGLMLTGKLVAPANLGAVVHTMVQRLGFPVIRLAIKKAMTELAQHFILGSTISEARRRAQKTKGFLYSYDMLGEAARTEKDAQRYFDAYADAIANIAQACDSHAAVQNNPAISVKLSSLHPRYERAQQARVLRELPPKLCDLARQAAAANMGFNIDAEESERLELSLEVMALTLSDAALSDWEGFGFAVQAYDKRAMAVLSWAEEMACRLGRRWQVRLVKGAYWDAEIKRAQTLGIEDYPVFTRKAHTDISYLACARRLFATKGRVYPQFATHNAHTLAAVLRLAPAKTAFELQRLHGMGESLHHAAVAQGASCRIYAPVGTQQDLLAYLMRRLLENGASSSFVHRLADKSIPLEDIAKDPFTAVAKPRMVLPADLYGTRKNSRGWELDDKQGLTAVIEAREAFKHEQWRAAPSLATMTAAGDMRPLFNPAKPQEQVGEVAEATPQHVQEAMAAAQQGAAEWAAATPCERAACLEKLADLYEESSAEWFALGAREAGKTMGDCAGEIREAVDFLRYYAVTLRRLSGEQMPAGVVVCVSPWNFPLAIFTGQIAAALAAGNAVLAKPAAQTPLIAAKAVGLMYAAGIPRAAVQLLPGGKTVGAALTAQTNMAGVCFTGSTATAQVINRTLAAVAPPTALLIAETGGLNAMIADSTALPEQLVGDVIMSAFQSAGQRCSALRILYVQKDIENKVIDMLAGAMDELCVGDPWQPKTDMGPIIDQESRDKISSYCQQMEERGLLLHRPRRCGNLSAGYFIAPTLFRVNGIADLAHEVFGPVLHLASFAADDLGKIVDHINAKGYGLTLGVHSRIDSRAQEIAARARVGNIYVNRNQIGAVVGSQPFGGEGLSGTGPKAGGPNYLRRLRGHKQSAYTNIAAGETCSAAVINDAIASLECGDWGKKTNRVEVLRAALAAYPQKTAALALEALAQSEAFMRQYPQLLPGVAGERNLMSLHGRGVFICLGDGGAAAALAQAIQSLAAGGGAVLVCEQVDVAALRDAGAPVVALGGCLAAATVKELDGMAGLAVLGGGVVLRPYRQALADREGAILPFVSQLFEVSQYFHERLVCTDTTAVGGNVELLLDDH